MGQDTTKKQSGFAGTLKNLQLIDIIQLCCLSVSTMAIKVTKEESEGTIFIQNGEVVHACQDETTGIDAFYTIMGWERGNFETFDAYDTPKRTIHEHYQFLLMESSRRVDETAQRRTEEAAGAAKDKLRVLIVDDSPIMTKILTSVYTAQGDIEIAGTAGNGKQAIEMIDTTRPDLITLDVNMPVMDGSTTLKHIMIKKPCPVIVMSNLGDTSQENVLNFLDLGAVDFMSKPVRHKNILLQQEKMIQRLRRCAESNLDVFRRIPLPKPVTPDRKLTSSGNNCSDMIIIASGACAPAAMLQLLNDLAENLMGPVVLLQALPPDLIPPMADFLDRRSRYHILSLTCPLPLKDTTVYAASVGVGLELTDAGRGYSLCPDEPARSDLQPLRALDHFLVSVSREFAGKTDVVVLSGADIDSLDGLEAIVQAGGAIILQDRATCILPGSLEFIKKSALPTAEMPLSAIARHILKTRNEDHDPADVRLPQDRNERVG
jgi:two-component system chemotaxis response regulator CheB